MKLLVTTSWRALILFAALFVISSAHAQQPCDLTINPSGEILFESVQGAAVYKVVTVTNTSANTLTVSMFQGGYDSSAFNFEPRSFTLQANGKKEFKVYFKPNSANTIRYVSSIHFSITPGTICTSVELIGTGTSIGGGDDKGLIAEPSSIKFPATDIDSVTCKEVTIKNASASAAVVSAISISGSEAFLIDGGLTFPLMIGSNETRTITVCYKPLEQAHFYASGKVEIAYILATGVAKKLYIALSSGANSGGDAYVVITPSQYQFKSTEIGKTYCEEFRVVNKSNMKALISSFSFEGDAQFTVESMTPLPVEINSWDSLFLKVCYTPTAVNSDAKGSITVNYSLDGGITIKHATAVFFAITEKPACLHSGPSHDWSEPILLGGKADRQLAVVNKTSSTITINGIRVSGDDAAAFTVNATTPITLGAYDTVYIPFTFAPFSTQNGWVKEKFAAAILFELSSDDPASHCSGHEGHLWGYTLGKHEDDTTKSVAISLFPEEKQTIGLSNRGIKESYTLLFKNNLDREIIVQSISLMNGTKFKIASTDPATTPFNLKSEATFTVTIEFESADGLLYKDKLIIVSDFAATAIEFDLQGINLEKALNVISTTLPEGVSVAVMPNPMRSNTTVDLEGVRSATIEVSDVLGSTIMSTIATGDWKWNGRMATGAMAPAGTYFIRTQGESTNGERFMTTQRIVIER